MWRIRIIITAIFLASAARVAFAGAEFGMRDPFRNQPTLSPLGPAPAADSFFPSFHPGKIDFSWTLVVPPAPLIEPGFSLVAGGAGEKMRSLFSRRLNYLDYMRERYLYSIISETMPLDEQLEAVRRAIRDKPEKP